LCETGCLIVREEQTLKMFENRVLRKIFGSEREEVTEDCRKLQGALLSVCVVK
jgi:hypothetical protein